MLREINPGFEDLLIYVWRRHLAAAVARVEALGANEEDLHTALEADGATLAQVAEDQGVAVDTVVQALVTAEQERIAQAVTDGRITQEQADERLADLEQRVTDRVNAAVGDHGLRGDRDGDGA